MTLDQLSPKDQDRLKTMKSRVGAAVAKVDAFFEPGTRWMDVDHQEVRDGATLYGTELSEIAIELGVLLADLADVEKPAGTGAARSLKVPADRLAQLGKQAENVMPLGKLLVEAGALRSEIITANDEVVQPWMPMQQKK